VTNHGSRTPSGHGRRVKLVLLDVDGTLVDHDGAQREAISGWIQAAHLPTQVGAVSTEVLWHQLAELAFVDYRAGRLTFQGQRRQRVSGFLTALGADVADFDDAALDAEFGQYLHRYEAAWRAFPDVVDALGSLRDLTDVAVLSNGDHDQQVDKLHRTGLGDLVGQVITSSDLAVAKPDPRAFHGAVQRLGVEPSQVLYCGDRLDIDAVAATEAGLMGVWLNRTGTTPGNLPVASITSLSELPGLLTR